MKNSNRTPPTAESKLMEYLARRDHSELELRQKLSRRFEEAEVEAAIAGARERGWLKNPEELSAQVSAMLGRKKKSHRFIQEYLKKRGLPVLNRDEESEIEKAREIVLTKFKKGPPFSFEEKPKVHRYLAYRGFDSSVIRKVIHERE